MAKFRKKPVVIEARQFPGLRIDNVDDVIAFEEWLDGVRGERVCIYRGAQLIIPTLEGDHAADAGDWIIQGVKGEIYPCKPDIFAATYEPA